MSLTRKITGSLMVGFLMLSATVQAQDVMIPQDQVVAPVEEVEYYTYKWEGERYPDGRPRVSDDLLERLKKLKVEDTWQLLSELGYRNQFEGGWEMIHQDVPFVGRALTAVYMPARPDVMERLVDEGLEAGHVGPQNSWPIDMLQKGDVYIADMFGKIEQGTLIGDNLGTSIFDKTHTGVVFDASLRDVEGLEQIEGFNAFVRDFHPSFMDEVMLMGINVPTQIGKVTVMPGDVILAKRIGIVVVPAHMVEQVVITAELVEIRDEFAHERIQQRVYTPGQIDSRWSSEMEEDFIEWLGEDEDRLERLPVPLDEMDEYLQQRTW